jgi:predicted  nucleic acid-binding Zn-ribbon protein
MHSDLNKLIDLQQVDSRIAALQAEVAALPAEVRQIEVKLAGSQTRVEAVRAAIKADEKARHKHESEIQDQQQKISKYRDQSLNVKTNQEYKALLSEIEQAEAEIRKLEDRILEIMVAADARKEDLKQAEATVKAHTAENEKEKEHARQQTAEDEKALAELNGQRQGLRVNISDDTLRHYDRVLKLRHSALAAVHEDEMCSVCRVRLRPQVFQDVMRSEEIVYCDSCQRILHFVPPPPKPEGEAEPGRKKHKAKTVAEAPQEEPAAADEATAH